MFTRLDESFGGESKNRIAETAAGGAAGARAALETFYYALNNRDAEAMRDVWLGDALVQLNNPLGGIIRGRDDIVALYERIFRSPAAVRVRFEDATEYTVGDAVIFAGRERGEYRDGDETIPLEIRTTRIFTYSAEAGGWRQVHHHGSIDDTGALERYRRVIMRGGPG